MLMLFIHEVIIYCIGSKLLLVSQNKRYKPESLRHSKITVIQKADDLLVIKQHFKIKTKKAVWYTSHFTICKNVLCFIVQLTGFLTVTQLKRSSRKDLMTSSSVVANCKHIISPHITKMVLS